VTPARIKICGLTRQEDVQQAEDLGAWAVGFIFHHPSPRYIEPEQVAKLLTGNPATLRVGVFVNLPKEKVVEIAQTARLTAIQLHGDETPEFCSAIKAVLPRHQLIKAFRLKSENELRKISDYSMCDARLIDAFVEGKPGGTGKIARWDLATQAKASGEMILSGGLNSDNIGQALGQVRPDGFDVSSGVEDSPGIKNHAKIREFIQTVRIYESQS
jgi:phosphoribosylanthranilate isomerase